MSVTSPDLKGGFKNTHLYHDSTLALYADTGEMTSVHIRP